MVLVFEKIPKSASSLGAHRPLDPLEDGGEDKCLLFLRRWGSQVGFPRSSAGAGTVYNRVHTGAEYSATQGARMSQGCFSLETPSVPFDHLRAVLLMFIFTLLSVQDQTR